MDVILLERIEKLGQMGDVVSVKPGYARNYLLPQQKAMRATKDNLAQFETRRSQLEAENLERRQEAEKVGAKMDGTTVILIRQASEAGQLFGSVTVRDVASAVTEAGFTIDRHQVALDRPIKTLGLHPIRVRLHPEVSVTVTASVAPSQDEAESLLKAAAAPDEEGEPAETTGGGEGDAEAEAEAAPAPEDLLDEAKPDETA